MWPTTLQCIEPTQYGLTEITPPATEPVTLTEAKTHCRVDIDADDAYITALIVAARIHAENVLGRRLITQTWDFKMDQFPYPSYGLRMPYGPWQSITHIKYLDPSGTEQTLASNMYALDTASFENRLYPTFAQIWPLTQYFQNAVTIRYVAGYGTASSVPQNIKHAILLLVGHWYENREGVVTGTITATLPLAISTLLDSERQSFL